MKKTLVFAFIGLIIIAIFAGCANKPASVTSHHGHSHEHEGEHKTAHGGSLNAIVTCENGHAEVKIDGAKLNLWFVGGGSDTTKSVRVPDKSIDLKIKTSSGEKKIVLIAKPLDLSGEKIGDCSHFEGSAKDLKGIAKFTADGQVTFKGQKTPLRIEYPKGYDPD